MFGHTCGFAQGFKKPSTIIAIDGRGCHDKMLTCVYRSICDVHIQQHKLPHRAKYSWHFEGDRMKNPIRLAIPVALLAMAFSAYSRAQVLNEVPSSAIAVVKIKNLTNINAKAIKLAHDFGLDALAPEFKDPLGSVLEKSHMSQGVNKDGDVAVALFAEPDGPDLQSPPPMVYLAPVSDYKAFVGNFNDAKEDGGITTATGLDGKPLFITQWGDYAACAQDKALLANKPDGFKVAGLAAKEADSKDLTILANLDQIKTVGLPKLKEERDKMLDQIAKETGTDENSKKLQPMIRSFANIYMTVVQDYLEQGTSGVLSVDLSDAGISASTFAEFKPDSQLGQNFASLKGDSSTALFTGLPDSKYFAVGGYASDPKVSQQMIAHLVDPAIKELAAGDDQFKQLAGIMSSVKDIMGTTTGNASGYIVPAGAPGQDGVLESVSVSNGDAKTLRDDYRKTLLSMADLLKNGPQSANAPMTIDLKPDAKTVDGVSLDHMQTNLTTDPNDPKTAQAQQAIALLYGPNGVGSYSGVASDNSFIAVTGGNDQLISDLIASAKAGQDAISSRPYISTVAAHLSKKPIAVYYVFLDNIATSASKLAENFGFPIKLNLPENLPPIGFSVGTDGPSVRFDSFIPADLIQNMVSAGLKAEQGLQGGGAAQ